MGGRMELDVLKLAILYSPYFLTISITTIYSKKNVP
jgi:hypothetical protein